MHRQKKIIVLAALTALCCLTSLTLRAQTRISSPYSRYGLGSINQSTNARTLGMGSVSQAISGSLDINFNNPASYSYFENQSFVFNGGIRSRQTELETSTQTGSASYTSLGYLQFGAPVTRWMGISFGLIPFSNVGYDITEEYILQDIGRVMYEYEGTGGINQFYIGTGISITPKLSAGINATYFFGGLDFMRSSLFPDSANYLDTRINDRQSPGDIGLNYGILYRTNVGKTNYLKLGATFSNKTSIKTHRDYLVESIKKSSEEVITIVDTVAFDEGVTGDIILPARVGIGFVYGKHRLWELAGDFTWENWADYEAFERRDSLQNSFTAALGYEVSPQSTSVSPYWKKVKYRLGARYHKSYLEMRGTQLNQYGISFGLGLPIPKSASSIDLGVEFGQLGTTDNNLIKENYVKITLGLSIFERWFIKRKYD